MNSLQIQKIIENDQESKNIFGGVLAFDDLPKKVKWPSCYIINSDIRSKPGTHWLAVYYNKNGRILWFLCYGTRILSFGWLPIENFKELLF